MADDFTFSYSYQAGSPEPAPRPPEPSAGRAAETLYAAADCARVELPNGATLLLNRQTGQQLVVAAEVSVALRSCGVFRSLTGHAEHLSASIPELNGQAAEVVGVLEMVRDAGLMTPAAAVCQRLGSAESPVRALPATRVFVITCDRPAAVDRLLDSMLAAGGLAAHEQLVLVDDSRDPDNADRNRAAVARFNLTSSRSMQYLGARAQTQLLEALLAALPSHAQGLRFLIDRQRWAGHKTYGLSRTLCLLFSINRRAVVLDDDVLCSAMAAPRAESGILFGDRPREADFFTSQGDALARSEPAGFDPLSGHARCLGMELSQAIRELLPGELQQQHLQEANAAYLDLWSGQSPVLVTQCGSLGDPGMPGAGWLYTIDTASAGRLLSTPGGLDMARGQRLCWMGQPRPTFSKLAVISQVTGLDNSHLLPPYFPAFRGEDYLFGAMVEYLHPEAAVLTYPWSVPHFPLEDRSGAPDHSPATGKTTLRPAKYVTDRTVYQPGISPATRLGGLAQMAGELAEMSDRGLLALYREDVASARSAQAMRLETTLRDGLARPAAWQAYLQDSLANTQRALAVAAGPGDLPGVPPGLDDRALLDEFRDYAAGFAQALSAWPDVREAGGVIAERMLASGEMLP